MTHNEPNTKSNQQSTRPLPEREGLSYAQFAEEYLFPNQPVILRDGLKEWKAVGKWTPAFFRNRYPDRTLTIGGQKYSMADFIDRVENSAPGRVAPYFRNEQIRAV